MDGEIQRKIPPTLYCQSLLHSFIHQSLTLSLPEQHKGSGEWEWWSAHSSFTLSPCSHSLWQWGPSAGLQLPSGNIHLPQSGVLPWLQWVSDSPYPPWAWGNSLLPFSPSMGCRNISALAPETLPSLFLHWPCVCGMTSHAFLFLLTPFSHCHEAFSLYSLFPEGITSSLAGTAGSVHGAALAFPHRDQHCPSLSTANSWTPMPNTKPDTSFPKNVK